MKKMKRDKTRENRVTVEKRELAERKTCEKRMSSIFKVEIYFRIARAEGEEEREGKQNMLPTFSILLSFFSHMLTYT